MKKFLQITIKSAFDRSTDCNDHAANTSTGVPAQALYDDASIVGDETNMTNLYRWVVACFAQQALATNIRQISSHRTASAAFYGEGSLVNNEKVRYFFAAHHHHSSDNINFM